MSVSDPYAKFRYKHVLALNPYFGSSTVVVGIFPPTGLEYIAASMKDLVGKLTLLDLRYERPYQDPKAVHPERNRPCMRQHPMVISI
ncbi:MAG: hypothetical protein ACYSR4_08200 [Planctomycetota bacterium]|jgi:hypothetical protein